MLTTRAIDAHLIHIGAIGDRADICKSLLAKLCFILGLTQQRKLLFRTVLSGAIPVIAVRVL